MVNTSPSGARRAGWSAEAAAAPAAAMDGGGGADPAGACRLHRQTSRHGGPTILTR